MHKQTYRRYFWWTTVLLSLVSCFKFNFRTVVMLRCWNVRRNLKTQSVMLFLNRILKEKNGFLSVFFLKIILEILFYFYHFYTTQLTHARTQNQKTKPKSGNSNNYSRVYDKNIQNHCRRMENLGRKNIL